MTNSLSIIIINYNSFALTCDCIRSVLENSGSVKAEVVLVDNASTEKDPSVFVEYFPTIHLVKSNKNGGFAYGNNLGIKHSSGEYILLLNSDTIIRDNALEKCMEFARERNSAGAIGCRMIYPDGKVQYTARRFRSIGWELLDLFRFIPMLMPYPKRARKMLGKYFRHDENMECDWVNGAFFLFKRSLLNELPGRQLDDRFFMYGEDQLWCEQFRKLGYHNLFFAGATIVHINSGSTAIERQLALRRTMMKHELEIMKERKGKGFYFFIFRIIFGFKELSRNLIKFVIFKLTGKLLR